MGTMTAPRPTGYDASPDLSLQPEVVLPQVAQPEVEPPAAAHAVAVVEERSFARAVCRTCGWRGPGRRARAVAVSDIEEHHLLAAPQPTPMPTPVPAPRADDEVVLDLRQQPV
jgi:hypothetical protein